MKYENKYAGNWKIYINEWDESAALCFEWISNRDFSLICPLLGCLVPEAFADVIERSSDGINVLNITIDETTLSFEPGDVIYIRNAGEGKGMIVGKIPETEFELNWHLSA